MVNFLVTWINSSPRSSHARLSARREVFRENVRGEVFQQSNICEQRLSCAGCLRSKEARESKIKNEARNKSSRPVHALVMPL